MNEPTKSYWDQWVAEPRRFFLWLAALSLAALVLMFLAEVLLPSIDPPVFLRTVAAFILVGVIGLFLVGFFGFFLALIPPLRPLFGWIARRSLFLLACLITLVALFYALENWRGKRAWENFKRAAVAQGEPLELKEILPPPVPDAQNVAAAELFQPIGYEMDPVWRSQHSGPGGLTNTADRLKLRVTRERENPPENSEASWQRGRRTDLKAWQNYYRNPTPPEAMAEQASSAFAERYGISPGPAVSKDAPVAPNEFPTATQPQSPAADVLLALSKYDALIEELRSACERPMSRFPIHYEDGFSALLPHLSRMREINKFLALRTAAELEAGKTEQAFADLKLAFRMADLVRGEPLLISQLVRLAQFQTALNPLWEGLAEHRWTEPQLAAFGQQLAGVDFLADYRHGMRGERILCSVYAIDFVRREGRLEVLDMSGMSDRNALERMFGGALFHLIPDGWFDQNKASIGRMHLDLILPAVNAEKQRVDPAAVSAMASSLDQRLQRRTPYNFFAALLLPALSKASERAAQAQTAADLARVACALERHRIAHGQYPDSLTALEPRFLARLPHDIVTGAPLKYRRTDDGAFVLYSIGWNEKDDGGSVALNKDERSVNWKEGDWVWQYPTK